MPLLDLAQLYQPLHIVEDPAQIPCRGHAAGSGFKIFIISITNINMIPVIMVIAKILILPHQDFNDFSMRGSFRFVNTLCTDSTLTRCLLLIFPLKCISGNIVMMVISNLRNCPICHDSEREDQVDDDDDDEEDEGDKLS